MARKTGDRETERVFSERARYWRHYFDPQIRFIRPKFEDETWLTPYDPFQSVHGGTGYFAEGTGWQYTFFTPQDPYGLIEAMGGDRAFAGNSIRSSRSAATWGRRHRPTSRD